MFLILNEATGEREDFPTKAKANIRFQELDKEMKSNSEKHLNTNVLLVQVRDVKHLDENSKIKKFYAYSLK